MDSFCSRGLRQCIFSELVWKILHRNFQIGKRVETKSFGGPSKVRLLQSSYIFFEVSTFSREFQDSPLNSLEYLYSISWKITKSIGNSSTTDWQQLDGWLPLISPVRLKKHVIHSLLHCIFWMYQPICHFSYFRKSLKRRTFVTIIVFHRDKVA